MPDSVDAPSQKTDTLIGFSCTKVSSPVKEKHIVSYSGLFIVYICAYCTGSIHLHFRRMQKHFISTALAEMHTNMLQVSFLLFLLCFYSLTYSSSLCTNTYKVHTHKHTHTHQWFPQSADAGRNSQSDIIRHCTLETQMIHVLFENHKTIKYDCYACCRFLLRDKTEANKWQFWFLLTHYSLPCKIIHIHL